MYGTGTTVTIDVTLCLIVGTNTATKIDCAAPPKDVGTYPGVVINADGRSALSPVNLAYQGVAATNVVLSDTSMSFTAPLQIAAKSNAAAGVVVVTLPSGGYSINSAVGVIFGTGAGTLTDPTSPLINPTNFLPLYEGVLTITGTTCTIAYGMGAVKVLVGGLPCPVTGTSAPTQIVCTAPATLSAGSYKVVVINSEGGSTAVADPLLYQGIPTEDSLSPQASAKALFGGDTITITGTGVGSNTGSSTGTSVTVGGIACTGVNVLSATSITCALPAQTAAKTVAQPPDVETLPVLGYTIATAVGVAYTAYDGHGELLTQDMVNF
eukprot:gene22671-29821_t